MNAVYTEFGPPVGRLRHGIDAQSIGADDLGYRVVLPSVPKRQSRRRQYPLPPFFLSPSPTHQLLRSAAENHQYDMAIAYGQQLVNSETAGPDDLLTIAQSYSAINDCSNARRMFLASVRACSRCGRFMRRCNCGPVYTLSLPVNAGPAYANAVVGDAQRGKCPAKCLAPAARPSMGS